MQQINDTHISHEAFKIHQSTGNDDANANWQAAVESLKIFPSYRWYSPPSALPIYSPNEDYYGLHSKLKGLEFFKCREMFERAFYLYRRNYYTDGLLFYHKYGFGDRIANFIRDIELEKLTLHQLSTFMKVNCSEQCVHIKPSRFWTESSMRFSLFTILLRCGKNYFYNSIEDTIQSYSLANQTFPAIKAFLDGRRNYIGYHNIANRYGWWFYFNEQPEHTHLLSY